jgi:small subunit ribosomal protein S6
LREYEFTFVVHPEISDEGVQAISQRFEGILSQHKSEKLFYEDWGRRRLAYEIRNFQKGHYQVLHFLSDGKVVPELERSARLDDSILRFLTVLANEAVVDVEARRSEGVAFEEERKKRAAEKAVRDAEEAARAAEEASQAGDEARGDDDEDEDEEDDADEDRE